jgi:hypothetical protein
MVSIRLKGRITENGDLEIKLPEGLPPGEVQVTVEVPAETNTEELPWEERPWTDEEIREMLKSRHPLTGAEIVERLEAEGGWEDMGITDSNDWLEAQRRRLREQNAW